VSSPLDLSPTTNPLPKFKDHLPKFLGNGTISTKDHLSAFYNACHNIGANDNDSCMRLFVNSLEGKATTDFFELPPKVSSSWDGLVYWFKSNMNLNMNLLKDYNNIIFTNGETIKSFNLRFTKLYNYIPKLIRPYNQDSFIQYYNTLPSCYPHRLEKKNVTSLGSALQSCLEYEEKMEITSLLMEDFVKKTKISTVLKLVQDMSDQMIAFERK